MATRPNRLAEEMAKKGYSFRDLSFLTKLNAGYLCRVANGKRHPSPDAAMKVARALEISPLRLWK